MKEKRKTKKISAQLLLVLVPMIATFIIVVAVIIFVNSRTIIVDEAVTGLAKESEENSKISRSKVPVFKGFRPRYHFIKSDHIFLYLKVHHRLIGTRSPLPKVRYLSPWT